MSRKQNKHISNNTLLWYKVFPSRISFYPYPQLNVSYNGDATTIQIRRVNFPELDPVQTMLEFGIKERWRLPQPMLFHLNSIASDYKPQQILPN